MNTSNFIKIYAVISVKGQWGAYEEYVEKCFVNFYDAVEYAICIDQSHQKETHPPIPENVIDDVDEDIWLPVQIREFELAVPDDFSTL